LTPDRTGLRIRPITLRKWRHLTASAC
jgi:hypothetical protein